MGVPRWTKPMQNFLSVSVLIVGCPGLRAVRPKSLPCAGTTSKRVGSDHRRQRSRYLQLSRDLGHADRGCQQSLPERRRPIDPTGDGVVAPTGGMPPPVRPSRQRPTKTRTDRRTTSSMSRRRFRVRPHEHDHRHIDPRRACYPGL